MVSINVPLGGKIANAVTQALAADAGGQPIQINLAAGVFNESVDVTGVPANSGTVGNNGPRILFRGAGSGQTTWNGGNYGGTVVASHGAYLGVAGMTLMGTGAPNQSSLFTQFSGSMIAVQDDIVFGPANAGDMHSENMSQMQLWQSYTIGPGEHVAHIVSISSFIELNPTGIIITLQNPNFSSAFALSMVGGKIYIAGPTKFVGQATGMKWYSDPMYSSVFTDGIGGANLPGDKPGQGMCF